MTVRELVAYMEREDNVHIWDANEDDSVYEGSSQCVPDSMMDRKITGIYSGYYFVGIEI